MRAGCRFVALGILLSMNSVAVFAAGFSFTGTFTTDDQARVFTFQAAATSAVIRTWSYAGGTNFAGTVIPRGGFDTVLSLFGPDGTLLLTTPLLATNNDGSGGPNCTVATDPTSGAAFDACIDTGNAPTLVALIPGQTYFVVLSVSDNTPLGPNFGGGFSEQNQGNFTTNFGCGAGPFRDVTCTAVRTGNWAVDITGVTSTTTPAVSTPLLSDSAMILLTCGLIFVAFRRLRINGRMA